MKKIATSSTTTSTTTTAEPPKTIFAHYLKGTPKSRPRFVINGQQRPIVIDEETANEDSQINRPSTDDKNGVYRRIIFAKRPIEHALPPISDDFVEREDDGKITTGNTLRRQLHDETTKSNSPVDNSDDHSDVYGGSLSTTRPLFTTTAPPRILQRLSAARADRQKVYVSRENLGAAGRFDSPKYDEPRIYETETKPTPDERTTTQQILLRTTTSLPTENREYVRQTTTEPVYVRQQPEALLRELPPRVLVQSQPSNLDENTAYRSIPIGRLLFRPVPPGQQSIYSTTTDANVHYLTETPVPDHEDEARIAMNTNYMRPRPIMRPLIYRDPEQRRPILRPVSPPALHPDDRDYQISTTSEYPYRQSTLALPPEPPNPIAAPLSRRDFQMLLRRLLVSQYGIQALSYPKTYLEDALYDPQLYPSAYPPEYQTPIPRSELAYDQQLQYGERVPLERVRRPVYPRALNPLYQRQYDEYHDGRYPKRVYRQKFYAHDVVDDGDEILPAPIREALLLRMLNLAINAEHTSIMPTTMVTSTTPASRYRKTGPIRSVQIITDESDDEKDMIRKKI